MRSEPLWSVVTTRLRKLALANAPRTVTRRPRTAANHPLRFPPFTPAFRAFGDGVVGCPSTARVADRAALFELTSFLAVIWAAGVPHTLRGHASRVPWGGWRGAVPPLTPDRSPPPRRREEHPTDGPRRQGPGRVSSAASRRRRPRSPTSWPPARSGSSHKDGTGRSWAAATPSQNRGRYETAVSNPLGGDGGPRLAEYPRPRDLSFGRSCSPSSKGIE